MSEQTGKKRTATGVVVGDPKDKTISVRSIRLVEHPRYRKYIRRISTFKVHDEKHEAHAGDTVEIQESRPLSKTKHWRLVRVVSRRAGAESEGAA